jgi:hypothetical protein
MQEEDIMALRIAVATLEHPRLAARLAEIAGKPIELFNRALPETASWEPADELEVQQMSLRPKPSRD